MTSRRLTSVVLAVLAAAPLAGVEAIVTARAASADPAVSNYTDPTISRPDFVTTGPDGALWFTNNGNSSIGRISTAGTVTNYTDPTIRGPLGITAGPDGALWFTNGTANGAVPLLSNATVTFTLT